MYTLGWSDLALFSIFENLHISAAQSFHFQKITETLKINIYFWKLVDTSLLHQRTISKKKLKKKTLFNIHFYFPKMGRTVFDLCKVKIIFFFTSFLALKKNQIICTFPLSQASKKVLHFVVDFRVTVQIFKGLATKERGNI